jgi:YD repeat-containing protein
VTAADPSATSDTGTVVTRYAYDVENRLCRALENATVDLATLANPCTTSVSGTTSQNVSTRYTYDALGNFASMIDARGKTTIYGYDAAGRMITLTDGTDQATTYAYDALGRRTSQSQRGSANTLVSWSYDGAGRILTRVAGGQTTSYTYDDNGNRLTATNGAGTITSIYDRLNRALTVSVSDDASATTTYSYSLTSPSWTDPSGAYAATLDKFDRQVSLTDPIHGSSPFTWLYRADGQLATMAAPNANSTAFGYDTAARAELEEHHRHRRCSASRLQLHLQPRRSRPDRGLGDHQRPVQRHDHLRLRQAWPPGLVQPLGNDDRLRLAAGAQPLIGPGRGQSGGDVCLQRRQPTHI